MNASIRPLVVAFHNNRLVLMEQHEDCTEVRARAEYDGRVWKHTAIVYEREGVWFSLVSSELDDLLETDIGAPFASKYRETFEAEAFLDARGAFKHAVHRVATAQGKRWE